MRAAGDSLTMTEARRRLHVAQVMARAGLGASADSLALPVSRAIPKGWSPIIPLELAYLRLLRHDPDSAAALVAGLVASGQTTKRVLMTLPWFAPLRTHPRLVERAQ
jgi:hypothetical protein